MKIHINKTQKSPYYNSRDIAVYLSKIHRCSVLLGSATPSLESFYNAKIENTVSLI